MKAKADDVRITLDMPKEMAEELNIAVKRARMTKAQYLRIAIELTNLLSSDPNNALIIANKGRERQIYIPGITAKDGIV